MAASNRCQAKGQVGEKQELCSMHGQGQKSEQKPTTKNFAGFQGAGLV